MNQQRIEKRRENAPLCGKSIKYVRKSSQGEFGKGVAARDRNNLRKHASLKRLLTKTREESFPNATLRETRMLRKLKPENVMNLREILQMKAFFNIRGELAFNFTQNNLAGLLSSIHVEFGLSEIKKVMQQLLNGLCYIHRNKILHRDIKTTNVIITEQGVLKLTDDTAFGTIESLSNRQLWYRSPELLLGETSYGSPADLWGVGCIMAEMWTRYPLMPGATEQQQLTFISLLCGTICPEVWPGVENLELFKKRKLPVQRRKLIERLKPYIQDPYACDLLDRLLTLDPLRRATAHSALNHSFFRTDPMPCELGKMLHQHVQGMPHEDDDQDEMEYEC